LSFDAASVDIEPLRPDHDRAGFACGHASLDKYIREQARQDAARGVARVFVATLNDAPKQIRGYYTLSATAVAPADLPHEVARRLPRLPVPAALIGRLAVDRDHAGRGLGTILLADAVIRTEIASQSLAVAALVVDPIDDAARAFYRTFGFRDVVAPHSQMFLMRVVRKSP
jgi:ribosomal protein S18 acetylase RimI-like enzyme